MIMQHLFKELQQSYISSKMLPYQTTGVFNYWCLIEFVYAYQVTRSLTRNGIFLQKNLHILKLLMFDMQYWKCNNIYSAWKIKEKLGI